MRPTALAFALALAFPAAALAGTLTQGVAAGDARQTAAVLWGMPDADGIFSFEVATDAGFANIVAGGDMPATAGMPVKMHATGLNPGASYWYRGTDAAGHSAMGQFKTPHAGGRNGLAFGVSGDWRGPLAPYPAVKNVAGKALDVFVQLGDTIYAENYDAFPVVTVDTLAGYRDRYRETLSDNLGQTNQIRLLRQSTASLASIDDHEVVNDFAGGAPSSTDSRFPPGYPLINETPRYQAGLQAFHEYMPIRELTYAGTGDARMDTKPMLYRTQNYGQDAALFLLDNRSFRDAGLPGVTNPLDPVQVGTFLGQSQFAPRTLLGQQQLVDLQTDLLKAQQDGVTWKFVLTAEPIQKLGVIGASDRYEGYAAERDALLKFIDVNGIQNVVFVAADVHGTVVNNLNYFDPLSMSTKPIAAWEITTGPVAFADPFGPTVIELANAAGLLTPGQLATYDFLLANRMYPQLETFIQGLIDTVLTQANSSLAATVFGASFYDPVGLAGSGIPHTLLAGGWTATHTYGWTEFEIDPASQALTVTTWGVPAYDITTLTGDPAALAALEPAIFSQFQVAAVPEPQTWAMLLAGLGLVGMAAARRRSK
ncbi:MAG: alkaline phosphatase D family protein [Thiobacillaceae bacterium]|jgi:phosphodiesterase/alkaline phosphatase D-like protein|nr:alkaline phosphatase D family protein [Thiobacillaceae bacterium]